MPGAKAPRDSCCGDAFHTGGNVVCPLGLFYKPEFSKGTWTLNTGLLGDGRLMGEGEGRLRATDDWLLKGGGSRRVTASSPTLLHWDFGAG